MANAAGELFKLFEGWRTDSPATNLGRRGLALDRMTDGLRDHMRAVTLLGTIEREIDDLAESGRQVRVFRKHFPAWVQAVLALRSNSWRESTSAEHDFPQPVMDALEVLADLLDHKDATLDPGAVATLRALLEEILTAADEDDSLDERLRVHIRRVVRHLQTCIDEYDVYGQSSAMAALDAVWAAMGAAAHRSTNPTRWEKFQERFFFPTAAGLLANVPGLVMQLEQFKG